eukprot:GHVR01153045.1.p2 GENE.GHVR01153045.1~~GHVR01153045.1.p2  ORF type:complete len:101 (+),score=8.82 GHVR01153045.1:1459-1761(+)
MSILHLAVGTGRKDIVQLLIENGLTAEPDDFRRTPLMIAIRNNHNDIFFNLLFNSHKYYRRDYSFNNLLHYAAAYGNQEIIKYLIKFMPQSPNKKNVYPF